MFCPVMAAKSIHPCAHRHAERCQRFENRGFKGGHGRSLLGTGFGADNVCCASVAPNFHIGGRVAYVVEAGLREMLRKKRSFVRSLEIEFAVAGVDFVKKAEIAGDRCGKLAVGGCYKRDAAAGGFFLLDKIKNLLPIGQTSGVEMGPGGEMAFERGSSRKQPEGEQQERDGACL